MAGGFLTADGVIPRLPAAMANAEEIYRESFFPAELKIVLGEL